MKQSKQSTSQVNKADQEVLSTTEFTNRIARYKRAAYERLYQLYCPSELQELLTVNQTVVVPAGH